MVKHFAVVGGLALSLVACVSAPSNTGYVYACNDGKECPPGWQCGSDGLCHGAGGTTGTGSTTSSSSGMALVDAGCLSQFQAAHSITACGGGCAGMAAADFNGDHHLDLAVSDFNGDQPYSGGGVAILYNDGLGNLVAGANPLLLGLTVLSSGDPDAGYAHVEQLAAVDLNGDGLADLAATYPKIDILQTWINEGDGGFALGPAECCGSGKCLQPVSSPAPMALAVLPQAGGALVAVSDSSPGDPPNVVLLFLDAGVSQFSGSPPTAFFPDSGLVTGVALAALGGQTTLAASFAGAASGEALIDLLSGATVAPDSTVGAGASGIGDARLADLNGDGILDAVFVVPSLGQLGVAFGSASGFRTPVMYSTGGTPQSLVVVDLNQDGFLDVATVNLHGVTIFKGSQSGALEATQLLTTSHGQAATILAGDFATNGTAPPSLVVSYAPSSAVGVVDVFQTSCH